METVFDLEQKLAVTGAVRQSAPPVAVTFASGLLPPTHLNALRVVTVPPVENSPTNSTSPIACAPAKLTAPLVLEHATAGSCNSQRPKSPAPLLQDPAVACSSTKGAVSFAGEIGRAHV